MENEKFDKSLKRLAVLETGAHADEVIALAGGQDRIEHTYPVPGAGLGAPAVAFSRTGFGAGHNWESLRPLEAAGPARPVINYSERWRQGRGRFSSVKGFGRATVHVLLARRPF